MPRQINGQLKEKFSREEAQPNRKPGTWQGLFRLGIPHESRSVVRAARRRWYANLGSAMNIHDGVVNSNSWLWFQASLDRASRRVRATRNSRHGRRGVRIAAARWSESCNMFQPVAAGAEPESLPAMSWH
jgi:hypothetical protein